MTATKPKKVKKAKLSSYADEPWLDGIGTGRSKSAGSSYSKTPITKRCYESHPPYPVTDDLVVYGGSCSWPIVTDADVYIGLQSGMKYFGGKYPWSKKQGPVEFQFVITDMQAPSDPVEFRNLIEYMAEQLLAGKKVHVGCIGGHGRTGTVLAALRKHMTGDENATEHVRTHYCKKAVESTAQVAFLKTHWGITPATPTKSHNYGTTGLSKGSSGTQRVAGKTGGSFDFTEFDPDKVTGFDLDKKVQYHKFDPAPKGVSTGKPLPTEYSIWG